MLSTPQSNRTTIALIGRCNTGKSTLLNLLTGQNSAIVSPYAGTTTDPVYKTSELNPLGPILYIDTAGLNDESNLGSVRIKKSFEALNQADAILLLIRSDQSELKNEIAWLALLHPLKPVIFAIITACDLVENSTNIEKMVQDQLSLSPITISQKSIESINHLKQVLTDKLTSTEEPMIAHHLPKGSVVLLVMPQDIQAPKGRLILPQAQVLRELLDFNHRALCTTFNDFSQSLSLLKESPALIITDSQLFRQIKPLISPTQSLTSFSILMAGRKGDLSYYIKSTTAVSRLKPYDRVLILEACSHHALKNDIGRVQIPQQLEAHVGAPLIISHHTGGDLPADMSNIKLVVQCGSCMISRTQNINRLNKLKSLNLAVTNYGILLAFLSGQLNFITDQ